MMQGGKEIDGEGRYLMRKEMKSEERDEYFGGKRPFWLWCLVFENGWGV